MQNSLVKYEFLETIKSFNGEIYNLHYHQQRYERVLNSYGITIYKNLSDYLNPPRKGLHRCRIVYSIDSIDVSYHPYSKRKIRSVKLVKDDSIEYSQKSLNRDNLNKLFAKKQDCDEVLIVKNSLLADTSIANIALFKDGVWYTPKKPLLEGVTRQKLLEEKKIIQKDIFVDDINSYSKIAFLNAMVGFDEVAIARITKTTIHTI